MKITKEILTRLINEEIQNIQNEMKHADGQEVPVPSDEKEVMKNMFKEYEEMLEQTGGYYNETIADKAIEILKKHDNLPKDSAAKLDEETADMLERRITQYYSKGHIVGEGSSNFE